MAGPETPKLMVDVVVPSEEGHILLIRRGTDPYEGYWALPGGFVEVGETLETAAAREAEEETGLEVEIIRLVGVYSDPDRDPHGGPIPTADGTLAPERSSPLSEAEVGQRVRIVKVGDESVEVLNYLGERGLTPGRALSVKEVRVLDGVVTVEDEGGEEHPLGESLAREIFVQRITEPA